ncbi:programmed cell death protein 2 isoform X3 [Oryctolagus cuniculus]|uniref:programmed cell death protein 2 isoform X3 n=1 Tax=Oryctolagus cuniculus TaxID=9986 RepID=UPI00387943A0
MAAVQSAPVELGFAEEAPAWRLRSEQFPSKVGGRPAWLGAAGLPGPGALACGLCGRPLAFLLQVYAPLTGRADAFHRSLFLFCCREPPCCAGLRVFRNQLPRRNDFYSYDPPPEDPPPGTGDSVCLQLKSGAHLCRVCGCSGPKACSRCHKAHYCSREHQALDWKMGHKQVCAQPGEALEEELDSMAKHESEEDKIFQKFKTQISGEPEQILRYGRGITPIWISGEKIPQEKDIPDCPCGAKRILEFQVMPQLLNYLKADSLGCSVDWGVLAIFTCAESCSLGSGYAEEFVWKQDVTDTP